MDPTTVALVPLRAPGTGKSRLAGELDRDARAALAGAMLADVAAALRAAPLDRVVVAAGGSEAAAAAAALGLEVLRDPADEGLDAAVAAAAARLGQLDVLLIVAADLPRLVPDEVGALLARREPVVVAPTVDGGTGGLLRRPPEVIATAYGPGSAARHLALAEAAGVAGAIVDLPGFRHDVDTLDDLRALAHGTVGPATGAILDQLGGRLRRTG